MPDVEGTDVTVLEDCVEDVDVTVVVVLSLEEPELIIDELGFEGVDSGFEGSVGKIISGV